VRKREGIFFGLLVILFSIYFLKQINTSVPKEKTITELPAFKAVDYEGRLILSSELKGMLVLVVFLDPRLPDDVDFLDQIFSYDFNDLKAIIITNYPVLLKTDHKVYPKKITIFYDVDNNLKETFSVRYREGGYFLFGRDGSLLASGFNHEGFDRNLKIILNNLLKDKTFNLSLIAMEGDFLGTYSWLKQLEYWLFISEKKYISFVLFSKYCGSCNQDVLVEQLNNLFLAHRKNLDIIGILNSSFYDQGQLEILKMQSQAIFPLVLSDDLLSRKWDLLISDFNRDYLNNIVLFVSGEGRILKVGYLYGTGLKEYVDYVM